jgi:hypothetical protein
MSQCDRCGSRLSPGEEWVEVRHHHAHMNFGSRFCSADCAAAYLDDGLVDGLPPGAEDPDL